MKKLIKNIFVLVLAAGIVSCSDYTDGINEDPNNFTSAPADLLIGQANLEAAKLFGSNAARISGMFSDQFTGSDRQYISLNNYITTASDYDDEWDDIYADGLAQAKLAETAAAEAGNTILVGVSQIVQGMLIGEAAALWGDVPFTEALDYINYPNPSYDSQAAVLAGVQDLITTGISNVGGAAVASAYGAPVYVANDATWAQVGHSLKARYYMVSKEYGNALAEAKMGISSSTGSLMSAHSAATGAKNLFFQFIVEQRAGYLTVNGSNLYNLITGATSRLLVTPGDAERAAYYFDGIELNTNAGGVYAIDASLPIVTYEETLLIEAEAAQRTGGDATTPFNELRAHLAGMYGGDFPASTSTGNALLLEILEEKYLTLIGSLQVFHDVRRTNNALGVPVKGTGTNVIPQRFIYPQIEINSNDNFPGLVDLFTPTPVNQ